MNQIDSHVETLEHTEKVSVEQEDGSLKEQEITEYECVLYLSITARAAEQQTPLYDFDEEQNFYTSGCYSNKKVKTEVI